jgi:membrane associated rhomboid family serine protease
MDESMRSNEPTGGITQELKTHLYILGGLVALMWGIQIVNTLLGGGLTGFGIRPRSVAALPGILAAPLLHGNFRHLISNTAPFAMLGWLIMLGGLEQFWLVTAIVAGASGLGTWLLGAPYTVHIGASGVIFGYFGFLMARSYFAQSLGSVLMSVVVLASFGGMIWGILPIQVGISWEGHLFGLLGGVLAAKWLYGSSKAVK